MNPVCLAYLLAMLPVQPDITVSYDTFEFRVIARFPYGPATGRVVCGDADHDGLQELYCTSDSLSAYYILEFTPDMNYDTTRLGPRSAFFWFIGDLDRDGKTDIGLTKADSYYVFFVYESPDSLSLPLNQVCRLQGHFTNNEAIITDLDSDSALEITAYRSDPQPPRGICVHECVGNDSYAIKTYFGGGYHGCTPDIDRDGSPEIFTCGVTPYVYVYEAVANDSVIRTAICSLPHYSVERGAVCGAPDIDGDGRNEAIVFATNFYCEGILAVFESPENDSFEIVWHTYFLASRYARLTVAVGDVDGDGRLEIAASDGAYVHLFRCIGNDNYEQLAELYIPSGEDRIGLYDLNNDGKDEVICSTINWVTEDQYTLVYEYFKVGLAELQVRQLERVNINPTVVARGKTIGLDGLPDGTKVQV
ncbi:MAG: VCBS repeat-containing protein, partial [candidate division WOR-3 bacterium]